MAEAPKTRKTKKYDYLVVGENRYRREHSASSHLA